MSETEYARDGVFAFRSARLLDWAEERSGGVLAAGRGIEVSLATLRRDGGESVARALADAADRPPSVCVPDAETIDDLDVIAEGLRQALAAGTPVAVRCAPAFAGVLAGTLATAPADAPQARTGVLVVCGSYVDNTTRQLEHLRRTRGIEPIVLDLEAPAGDRVAAEAAARRVAGAAEAALARDRLALVATPRTRAPGMRDLEAGLRVAGQLARVVREVGDAADVVVAKGGVTSAVVATDGFAASRAHVVGPVMPGISLWRPDVDRSVAYLVVPGNVGEPSLLADLLDRLGL